MNVPVESVHNVRRDLIPLVEWVDVWNAHLVKRVERSRLAAVRGHVNRTITTLPQIANVKYVWKDLNVMEDLHIPAMVVLEKTV